MDNFDRDFTRMKIVWALVGVVVLATSIGIIGFIVWAIVMLMRFFGVV